MRSNSAEFVDLPSSFSKARSPSFGYGRRWEPRNPSGQDAPPATKYNTKSCFDLELAGPVFGRPGRHSDHSYILPSFTPGPGYYSTERKIGENAPKFSMKSRILRERKSETPSPDHYSPSTSFVEDRSYSGVTFGVGQRPFLTHRRMLHADLKQPGPGAYNIPSSFSSKTQKLPSIRAKAYS